MTTITTQELAMRIIADEEAGIQMLPPERLEAAIERALIPVHQIRTLVGYVPVTPTGGWFVGQTPTGGGFVGQTPATGGALSAQVGGNHYKGDKIQHIEFVHANNIPYPEACAMKYLSRHKKKNGVQDIDKAIHYCLLLRKLEYPDAPPLQKLD